MRIPLIFFIAYYNGISRKSVFIDLCTSKNATMIDRPKMLHEREIVCGRQRLRNYKTHITNLLLNQKPERMSESICGCCILQLALDDLAS